MSTSQQRPATILAAVDADPSARDAAVLANALCGAGHAAGGEAPELLLAAVVVRPRLPLPAAIAGDDEARLRAQLDSALSEVRGACAPSARTLLLSDRSPAHALREQIAREPVDTVVVGSSHRAADGEAFAGRTVRQVLHGAPCAVALAARGIGAPDGAEAGGAFALRRIVVGVDGSPEAAAALEAAATLAGRVGARLELVAVADDGLGLRPRRGPLGELAELAEWDEAVAARRDHARALVERAAEGLDAATEVRVGDPAEELASAAEGADLLVVGSRQWGALDRVVIGSTAEELLRGAPCSLLLVPRPHAADPVSAADADATGD